MALKAVVYGARLLQIMNHTDLNRFRDVSRLPSILAFHFGIAEIMLAEIVRYACTDLLTLVFLGLPIHQLIWASIMCGVGKFFLDLWLIKLRKFH